MSGPIFTLSGSGSISSSYNSIFTGVTNAVYLLSVNTGQIDGTYATFIVYLEEPTSTRISGNNVTLSLSGNTIQLKSENNASYNITWNALRLS